MAAFSVKDMGPARVRFFWSLWWTQDVGAPQSLASAGPTPAILRDTPSRLSLRRGIWRDPPSRRGPHSGLWVGLHPGVWLSWVMRPFLTPAGGLAPTCPRQSRAHSGFLQPLQLREPLESTSPGYALGYPSGTRPPLRRDNKKLRVAAPQTGEGAPGSWPATVCGDRGPRPRWSEQVAGRVQRAVGDGSTPHTTRLPSCQRTAGQREQRGNRERGAEGAGEREQRKVQVQVQEEAAPGCHLLAMPRASASPENPSIPSCPSFTLWPTESWPCLGLASSGTVAAPLPPQQGWPWSPRG